MAVARTWRTRGVTVRVATNEEAPGVPADAHVASSDGATVDLSCDRPTLSLSFDDTVPGHPGRPMAWSQACQAARTVFEALQRAEGGVCTLLFSCDGGVSRSSAVNNPARA